MARSLTTLPSRHGRDAYWRVNKRCRTYIATDIWRAATPNVTPPTSAVSASTSTRVTVARLAAPMIRRNAATRDRLRPSWTDAAVSVCARSARVSPFSARWTISDHYATLMWCSISINSASAPPPQEGHDPSVYTMRPNTAEAPPPRCSRARPHGAGGVRIVTRSSARFRAAAPCFLCPPDYPKIAGYAGQCITAFSENTTCDFGLNSPRSGGAAIHLASCVSAQLHDSSRIRLTAGRRAGCRKTCSAICAPVARLAKTPSRPEGGVELSDRPVQAVLAPIHRSSIFWKPGIPTLSCKPRLSTSARHSFAYGSSSSSGPAIHACASGMRRTTVSIARMKVLMSLMGTTRPIRQSVFGTLAPRCSRSGFSRGRLTPLGMFAVLCSGAPSMIWRRRLPS